MSDLDPFADEDPRGPDGEPEDLDDWARTRAQPVVQLPYELRGRIARQGSAPLPPPAGAAPPSSRPMPPQPPPQPQSAPVGPRQSASGQAWQPDQARHRSIRAAGPFVALLLPLVAAGLTALFWRVVPCDGSSCAAPGAAGWAFGALAAPTAPVAGLPWQTSTPVLIGALASSVVVWLFVGRWAAARATTGPVATWGGFARQLRNLAIGMWLGVLCGMAAMAVVLTQT